jgi:hypothetical protein
MLIGRLAGALIWLGWKRWSLTEIPTLALCCVLPRSLAKSAAMPSSVTAKNARTGRTARRGKTFICTKSS